MNPNSIANLLLKQDPPEISGSKVAFEDDPESGQQERSLDIEILDDGETIPYNYIRDCREQLGELEARLQSDIYRGILLEVVQRILSDV